jgi:hypothetical protein
MYICIWTPKTTNTKINEGSAQYTYSMVDPTWLPSTIMQTIGALYGIFIAIFILVIQGLFKYKKDIEENPLRNLKKTKVKKTTFIANFDTQIYFFKKLFIVLAYFVICVELYNGMLVYFISDSIFDKFNWLLLISYIFFIVLLVYIIGFSYYLVSFFISLEMGNPDYCKNTVFDKIYKINFLDGIIFLACIFISITFCYYVHIKNDFSAAISVVFSIIVFSILIIIIWIIKVYGKTREVKSSKTRKLELVVVEKNAELSLLKSNDL